MNAASAGIPELGLLFSEVERLNRPPSALSKAIAGANAFPVLAGTGCTGDLHMKWAAQWGLYKGEAMRQNKPSAQEPTS